MFNKVLIFSVFVLIVAVYSKPITKGLKQCYGKTCPEETYSCEKYTTLHNNRTQLKVDVKCLGLTGDVLDTMTEYHKNPFEHSMFFQSYSYTGSFSIQNKKEEKSNDDDDNDNNDADDSKEREPLGYDDRSKKSNEVEVFSH